MNRRHDDYRRDWSGTNYHRPYAARTRRHTTGREWCARLIFGIYGGLVLAGFFSALLFAPEIRRALAAWHG